MPKTTKPRKAFNVVLDENEKHMLDALSLHHGTSAAQEIRQAIRTRYAMACKGVPTCANGTACFVPQMHAHLNPVLSQSAPRPADGGIPQ